MTGRCAFLPLLLVLVIGCRPANAPVGPNDASKPSIADSTTATAMPPSADRQAVQGQSMCAAQESVLFSCETEAGKRVSLCASRDAGPDRGHVYYAHGLPGEPELVFPAEKRPPEDFRRTHLTFAGSTGGYAYSFENNAYRYIVYSISGADGLEDQGVLVTRTDPRTSISSLPCRKGTVVQDEDEALLDLTLSWPADPDLEQHGLPRRK